MLPSRRGRDQGGSLESSFPESQLGGRFIEKTLPDAHKTSALILGVSGHGIWGRGSCQAAGSLSDRGLLPACSLDPSVLFDLTGRTTGTVANSPAPFPGWS